MELVLFFALYLLIGYFVIRPHFEKLQKDGHSFSDQVLAGAFLICILAWFPLVLVSLYRTIRRWLS